MVGPVIVGTSGSAASFHALRSAVSLHGDERAYVVVYAAVTLEDEDHAQRILDDAVDVAGGRAQRRVVLGAPPGEALCAAAAGLEASEVVVGARPTQWAWAHPVAAHVLRHAPCPVLLAVLPDQMRPSPVSR